MISISSSRNSRPCLRGADLFSLWAENWVVVMSSLLGRYLNDSGLIGKFNFDQLHYVYINVSHRCLGDTLIVEVISTTLNRIND